MSSEYTLKIDFEKGTENPERVFKSMADLIQSFRSMDQLLAESVCAEIEPTLILQEIETGSIKTKLASVLKTIDDSALKELNWKKIVGSFLVKGKYFLLEYLEDKETIEDVKQIEEVQSELSNLAKETDVLHFAVYPQISVWKLLIAIQEICDAIKALLPKDQAVYITDLKPILITPKLYISQESIVELLVDKELVEEQEMVLKVKKPDFLGQSMWEMKHGIKSIPIKITDKEWLVSFQQQKQSVLPGDSLRCLVLHKENIDQYGELVSESYQVIKVWDVIKKRSGQQMHLPLFKSDNKEN